MHSKIHSVIFLLFRIKNADTETGWNVRIPMSIWIVSEETGYLLSEQKKFQNKSKNIDEVYQSVFFRCIMILSYRVTFLCNVFSKFIIHQKALYDIFLWKSCKVVFNYETGLLNSLLGAFGIDPVNVYSMPGVWPFIICLFNSWKWCGYNSVIYIAAITGVDQEIYEAGGMDGANIFQRIWYITLPSIKPTIITMLLLQVGRILRGDFEMFYQIVGNNGQLYNATDVIDTYVFR